jgi:hypothetical protein
MVHFSGIIPGEHPGGVEDKNKSGVVNMKTNMTTSGLTFGIYPLRTAGTPFGVATGPADDYEKILRALCDLKGESKQLISRTYLIYTPEWEAKMLALADNYLEAGLIGDLVVGCGDWTQGQEPSVDLDNWLGFIRKVIGRYGTHLQSLQITNEPNLSFMEGSKAYTQRFLVAGVLAAKTEIQSLGLPVPVGFGSVPDGPMAVPHFWEDIAKLGGDAFINAVDFVGHNFYIDVFEDKLLELKEVPAAVERVLRSLRAHNLAAAGIPASVPIRVTENGWPTGENPVTSVERTDQRQQEVLEAIIRAIYDLRSELNISQYVLFGLRDADSSKTDLFHQYGIMRDDYSPKPAYASYQKLLQELGA